MSDFNNTDLQSHFDENGYIAINPLFSDNKIEEIKIELTRYIKEVAPKVPDHHVFYENKDDKSTIKQLQQMFTYDDYFKDLIENSSIREVAEIVLREKAEPQNLQFFISIKIINGTSKINENSSCVNFIFCNCISLYLWSCTFFNWTCFR